MTPTDFNRNATDEEVSYTPWFEIDICTPPVEEEEDRNTEHRPTEHNSSTEKNDTKTTSREPPLTDEPVRMPEIRIPSFVTERPPVRMVRPPVEKKEKKNVFPPRWEEVFSSLLRDNPDSEMEALLAMALRHERSSPGTGLPFLVTHLGTNPWFAILYERMDADTQKILLSSAARPQEPEKAPQFSAEWLLFVIGCLLTPLFLLLRKWNEFRHVKQSWDYTDIEEQY
jgi:hypothetical protein